MKSKILILLIMCALIFTGCENNSSPSIDTDVSKFSIEEFTDAEKELYNYLDVIYQKVEVGTAGCSLKAVKYTADLMNWAIGTTLTQEQITMIVNAKLYDVQDDKETFLSQISLIKSTYKELLLPSRDSLLETSGNNEHYAWMDVINDETTSLEAMEHLFVAFEK